MDSTVIVALISAGSSALVAITALLLNYRGFASIDSRFSAIENRFAALENRVINLENRLDRRLDAIQSDIKEFYRILADFDKRISKLEDRH
jgi:hypothetical protein